MRILIKGDDMNKKYKNLLRDSFFDDINGRSLDIYQRKIVLDNSESLLVVAGAGSGKTLTIIGKIKYLIEKLGINEREILCISFTNETVTNLKQKVGYDIDCFTFHKLSLTILNDLNYEYYICDDTLLDYVTDEFFEMIVFDETLSYFVMEYLKGYIKDNEVTYNDIKENYQIVLENYKRSIKSFIKKIKTNNHNYNDFKEYVLKNNRVSNKDKTRDKNKAFLIIVFHILKLYAEELLSTKQIDFDDMISIATNMVYERGMKRHYKYIIIDEFQDTSRVRYLLIKEIINKTKAKLMCVGDDYQSIYRFSGCNLDLFINFKKYFNNAKIMYIKNTYRNSYQVIDTSCSFVRKNKYQLQKKLIAQFSLKNPIKIIYYEYDNYRMMFNKLLDYLDEHNQKNILVLGRYNNDIKEVTGDNYRDGKIIYKDLDISYLTVHRSKGLECDDIIILNMSNKLMGFPSQREDDKVFDLINIDRERYPYAEERRLFYVALTRTKKNVYLMVPTKNPSIFIDEIKPKTVDLIIK